MSKHIDICGTQILTGDFIVYGAMRGQSVALNFGLVKELRWQNNLVDGFPKISCVTVEKHWKNGWQLQKKGGRVSLQLAAVRVLRPDTVLLEICELLRGVP